MKDSWDSSDPYEYFIGRWSRLAARSFIDWLSPSPGLKWLDVGCGSGALSEAVINNQKPAQITAIDQSEGFVIKAQKHIGSLGHCIVGTVWLCPSGFRRVRPHQRTPQGRETFSRVTTLIPSVQPAGCSG